MAVFSLPGRASGSVRTCFRLGLFAGFLDKSPQVQSLANSSEQ